MKPLVAKCAHSCSSISKRIPSCTRCVYSVFEAFTEPIPDRSYHADEPAVLVKLQNEHWKPILDWAQETFGVDIKVSDSLFVPSQSPETLRKFEEVLNNLSPWEMAAMERATYSSKSFLIALALITRRLDVNQAAEAAHVEVNSQIERWGEVEDTHDVDYHDMRRQLGSAACLLANY
ncbi:hypothetical protein C8Q78DRAFT_265519 [Trametes maxima]|nr:hypothetical protein C8Q78DRAFT_265519 [Trametes maxima]